MITKPKTIEEIEAMREGGRMLATVLKKLETDIKPGISTKDLAIIADKEITKLGGKPAFLDYQGFPDVICISVNEEIVHGIPSKLKILKDGDIVGLDFGVLYKGLITDAAISLIVGRAKQKGHIELIKETKAALYHGIKIVKDEIRTGDIGHAIESSLKSKYGIVKDLVGHGVGHAVHEDPNIPNYGRAGSGPWLTKNMTIAIEPMVTLGSDRIVIAPDGWTVLTADGSYSAHFEHTILITDNGHEILTSLSG